VNQTQPMPQVQNAPVQPPPPPKTPEEELKDAITAKDAAKVTTLATTDDLRAKVLTQVQADVPFIDQLVAANRATWCKQVLALAIKLGNFGLINRTANDVAGKTAAVKEAIAQTKAAIILTAIGSSGSADWKTAVNAADYTALVGAMSSPISIAEANAGVWLLWGDGTGRDAGAGRMTFSKIYSARVLPVGDTSVIWPGSTSTQAGATPTDPPITYEWRSVYMPVGPDDAAMKELLNAVKPIPPAHVNLSQIAFVSQYKTQWRQTAPVPTAGSVWTDYVVSGAVSVTAIGTSYYLDNCHSIVIHSTASGAIAGTQAIGNMGDGNAVAVGGNLTTAPDGLLTIFQNHARHEVGHAVGAKVFQGMAQSGDDFANGYGGWAASNAAAVTSAYWTKNATTEIDWTLLGGAPKQIINDVDVAAYIIGMIAGSAEPAGNAITALPGPNPGQKLGLLAPKYSDQALWKYFAPIGGLATPFGTQSNGYMFPGFTPPGDEVHIWCSRATPAGWTKYSKAAYTAMVSSHGWYSLASYKEMFAEMYTKKYSGGAAPAAVNGKDPSAFFHQLETSPDTKSLTSVVGAAEVPNAPGNKPATPGNAPVVATKPTAGPPAKSPPPKLK